MASISNGSWVEVFPGSDVLNFGDLIDRRVEVLDGEVVLPDEPGIGFDFDEAGVEKFATEPWS